MTNRQFNFSLLVGIALAAVGGLILSKATVGLSLIALGIAIGTLAVVTRVSNKPEVAAAPSRPSQDTVSAYSHPALTD